MVFVDLVLVGFANELMLPLEQIGLVLIVLAQVVLELLVLQLAVGLHYCESV